MKRISLAFVLGISLMVAGCKPAVVNPPLAPGSFNQADQTIYSALMVAQASLNSLKTSLDQNPELKPYVNQAIFDYNIAEVAWQTYHTALSVNPSTSPAAAQAALSKVQGDLSSVPKVTP